MSTKAKKRQPSKSEQARRKRQSAGERSNANRLAKQRQRTRDSWADRTRTLLIDYDTGKRMLDNNADLADRLFAERAGLPEKHRGIPPVTVMEGRQRKAKSGEATPESRFRNSETNTPDTAELNTVVDVSQHREPPQIELGDLPGLEKQAISDLAYVKNVMAWKEPKTSSGSKRITAHTSWLMFDGYAFGTLWPNGLPVPTTGEADVHSLLRRPPVKPYPWPGRFAGYRLPVVVDARGRGIAAQLVTVTRYRAGGHPTIVDTPFGQIRTCELGWPNSRGRPENKSHYHVNWAEWGYSENSL